MNAESLAALSEVAQEVLRATAFAFGDPCPAAELPDGESKLLIARLQFDGHVSGALQLAAPPELCAVLAADALSEDVEQIGSEKTEDSLKELLNVIGGNWLTAVYGNDRDFSLSTPVAGAIDAAEWDRLRRNAASAGLIIDERPLLVSVHLNSGAEA